MEATSVIREQRNVDCVPTDIDVIYCQEPHIQPRSQGPLSYNDQIPVGLNFNFQTFLTTA